MNENLNLVELLKDCPKGTKFYSTIYGDVYLKGIDLVNDFPIMFKNSDSYSGSVTNKGLHFARCNGECTLFPSRDQRDWSKWQRPFVDGDIIFTRAKEEYEHTFISIFKEYRDDRCAIYVAISTHDDAIHYDEYKDNIILCDTSQILEQRLATEEEKRKLFDAIKEHGYKWDAEAKMMEKLPKDRFDPKTLKPFDKVLCRMDNDDIWGICLFERYIPTNPYPFFCIQDNFSQCIPYEGNEHLLGTTNGCDDFYKTWED